MNKTFKYAISVVLSAAMVTPALAQRDNFPDVADTHWAFEAVARLKKKESSRATLMELSRAVE